MAMSKKMLAIVAVLAVVVVVIIAAVALGGGNTSANNNNNDNGDGNDNDNNSNTNTRDQIANVSYSGSGDKVSEKFDLQAGVTIFHMTHSGSSNFAVTLYNEAGEYTDLLANEIGNYNGATLIGVKASQLVGAEPGKHYLQIEADGAWNIIIEQPRVASGTALPKTLTGSGPDASIPLQLSSGVVLFNMTHSGSSNFAVTLWSDGGSYEELLANEIGDYSGEKSVTVGTGVLQVAPGIAWLNVDADGAWTIKITKM